mgnify:CR=1 FL=1
MKDNKRTTKQVIAEQQAINRKLWAKENGRLHHVDANKLIAEFMGWKRGKNEETNTNQYFLAQPEHWYLKDENELEYHTSWDWLMPVIEEIDHLQRERIQGIEDALSTRCLGDVYNAVVEFINEHNKYICGSCGDHVNEVVFNHDADVDECTNCTEYYER